MLKIESLADDDVDVVAGAVGTVRRMSGVVEDMGRTVNMKGRKGDAVARDRATESVGTGRKTAKKTTADALRSEAEAIYGAAEELHGDESWEDLFDERGTDRTITKLTPGMKDANRVNVFLDGRFAFSLDIAQVVDLGVKVGQKVDSETLQMLRGASEFGKLYQRTLEWILTRPHSIRETQDYLRRCQIKRHILNRQRVKEEKRALPEIEDHTIELVVERLIEKKYLDDKKFAAFFVENRLVRKGVSPKRLKMELKRKGIDDKIAQAALEVVDRPEEEEILKIIKKKRAKYDDHQLVSYLVRQGFDYQKSKDAVAGSSDSDDD